MANIFVSFMNQWRRRFDFFQPNSYFKESNAKQKKLFCNQTQTEASIIHVLFDALKQKGVILVQQNVDL